MLLIPLGLVTTALGFRRRRREQVRIGVGLLLLSDLIWWRTRHAEFWIIDDCLDAGGRYDPQAQACEFE